MELHPRMSDALNSYAPLAPDTVCRVLLTRPPEVMQPSVTRTPTRGRPVPPSSTRPTAKYEFSGPCPRQMRTTATNTRPSRPQRIQDQPAAVGATALTA